MSDLHLHPDVESTTTKRPPANHVRGCEVCGIFPTTLCGLPQPSTMLRVSRKIQRITCVVCRDLWHHHVDLHEMI